MMKLDTHPRTLRRNIWAGLMCASDQEIRDGFDFYPGANGLCRLIASMHPPVTVNQIAGIYAALSPMNTWDTNVANVLDVMRLGWNSTVNTTHINHWKALAIMHGADPIEALGGGKKVHAFYLSIANPDDNTHVPVDRHLICLALGVKITSNAELSAYTSAELYGKIEAAYLDLGKREGIGNRLASIAWFVQRRIANGQIPIPHPDSPICCGVPLHSQGSRRFHCNRCGKSRLKIRQCKYDPISPTVDAPVEFIIGRTGKYPIVYLPSGHPHRNKWGWQYLARHVVMNHTGEILRKDEHVHHGNGIKMDCRLDNLEVWLDDRHGRHHGKTQLLYMLRDVAGRWAPSNVPSYAEQLNDMSDIPF